RDDAARRRRGGHRADGERGRVIGPVGAGVRGLSERRRGQGGARALMDAVIFDCDGTLVDSEPLARRSWERLLGDRGYALTDADYAAVLGLPYDRVHGF